jgi:hypothetical protein
METETSSPLFEVNRQPATGGSNGRDVSYQQYLLNGSFAVIPSRSCSFLAASIEIGWMEVGAYGGVGKQHDDSRTRIAIPALEKTAAAQHQLPS